MAFKPECVLHEDQKVLEKEHDYFRRYGSPHRETFHKGPFIR